jgi:hypothetical protein
MASRNRTEMSTRLFERLASAAKQRGIDIDNASKGRFIRGLSCEDAELMAKADAVVLTISRQVRMVRITSALRTLFCVFGLPEPYQIPLGLELDDLTPGLFAVSVLEANVQPPSSITASKIRDTIEAQFVGSDNYEGHQLEEIASLFPSLNVYRVAQVESYMQSDFRVLGALVARSYVDGPILISSTTLEKLWTIFERGSKYIPHRNLVQGLMAISWENLFLEAYRCLEQLYAEPRVSALKAQWKSTRPLQELAILLEQHLSWRPKEDDALAKIISCADLAYVEELCNAFGISESLTLTEGKVTRAEKVSRRVYELRNNIVHYRPRNQAITKSELEWDKIVSALLDVINVLYDLRGEQFFEADTEIQTVKVLDVE